MNKQKSSNIIPHSTVSSGRIMFPIFKADPVISSGVPASGPNAPNQNGPKMQTQQQQLNQANVEHSSVAPPAPGGMNELTTQHPCKSQNISTCFHLIALHMNKTEELLQMANETLSSPAQPAGQLPQQATNAGSALPGSNVHSPPAPNPSNAASNVQPNPNNASALPISARVEGEEKAEKKADKGKFLFASPPLVAAAGDLI